MPSLESLSSLGFDERNLGCPGNFAGMSRTPGGVQKVCAKNAIKPIFDLLLTYFGPTFRISRKPTFDLFFAYFDFFGVLGLLGGPPPHNSSPHLRAPI